MTIEPPDLKSIQAAAQRMRDVVLHTPLIPLHAYDDDHDILLKPEIHQCVTSFKIRGIMNAVSVLDDDSRRKGLSTVSAGNTAQALAWVGRLFNVTARSIMPDTAPATKIEAVRRYGGEPVLVSTDEVFRFLREHLWEQEPYAFIHPWTNRDVMIGHATMGLEIAADAPDVQTVYVPVGGGALMSGVAAAVKAMLPSARLVAVQPEGCAAFHASLRLGRATSVACTTICDGVAIPYFTEEVFAVLRELVDEVVLVSEDDVKSAIRRLALRNRMIVEPAGALSVAAALNTPRDVRGRSVCVITGGSIDTDKLTDILKSDTE